LVLASLSGLRQYSPRDARRDLLTDRSRAKRIYSYKDAGGIRRMMQHLELAWKSFTYHLAMVFHA
jgi:hypothetical protein